MIVATQNNCLANKMSVFGLVCVCVVVERKLCLALVQKQWIHNIWIIMDVIRLSTRTCVIET